MVYTYTGKLTDFGDAPFPGAIPSLWVEPHRDAFSTSGLSAARRIPITVASNGSFSVDLEASADLTPPTGYSIRCEWLEVVGGPPRGWAQWDFTADIGGGPISTMAGNRITRVWYATTQPPVNRPGVFWIHPGTGDVKVWGN